MPDTQEDLWPRDIVAPPKPSPVGILKSQALRLGAKTAHFVDAEVRSFVDNTWLNHSFELVIPMMDNYHFPIFKVAHKPSSTYPVDIWLMDGKKLTAEGDTEFKDRLKEIFSSKEVRTVIQSFINIQGDDQEIEPEPEPSQPASPGVAVGESGDIAPGDPPQ